MRARGESQAAARARTQSPRRRSAPRALTCCGCRAASSQAISPPSSCQPTMAERRNDAASGAGCQESHGPGAVVIPVALGPVRPKPGRSTLTTRRVRELARPALPGAGCCSCHGSAAAASGRCAGLRRAGGRVGRRARRWEGGGAQRATRVSSGRSGALVAAMPRALSKITPPSRRRRNSFIPPG